MVIIPDFKMSQMHGAEFLAEVKQKAPETVQMMHTGSVDLQTSIEVIKKGLKVLQRG